MQIRELISSGSFPDLNLLTGDHGLDTQMKDVVLLEYESLKQDTPDYYLGDFIISTLFYAKDRPDLLYDTVSRLIDLGASGMAFKSSYYKVLPGDVRQLAQEKGFPIFMFDDLYIEDVILTISDYLRHRQEFSMYEDSLYKIIDGREHYSVEQFCANMNPNRLRYMTAAFVHAPDLSSQWHQNLRQLLQLRNTRKITNHHCFLQFRRGFFIILNHQEQPTPDAAASQVKEMLEALGCPTSQLCIGLSPSYERSTDFDCLIQGAYEALLVALSQKKSLVFHSDLRLYRNIFPMLRDKSIRLSMEQTFKKLEEYDKDSTSGNLLTTLYCYAENNYDIKTTAEAMNQHQNTIRYRLKKICDLTASPMEVNHALFLMGEFHRMLTLCRSLF